MKKNSAREFVEQARNGSIDLHSFYEKLHKKLKTLQEKYEPFITIAEKESMEQLGALENNKNGVLYGLPISVKDNICTKGIRTTAGSRILEPYVPPFDATCISRTRSQGGVIIGKTAMDEFGFGTHSTNCAFCTPKNPVDPERSPGGSSGGSAVITKALEEPHISIGESTGGSISCPASFCGVVGFTPTYGRISRYGLIDYANSLDKIGVIAKSVEDAALLYTVMAGWDPRDHTSIREDAPSLEKIKPVELKGLKIGVPKEYMEHAEEPVRNVVHEALSRLEREGATLVDVSLEATEYALPAYYVIATSEASTNLAKFCGMRYGAEEPINGRHFDDYFSSVRGKYFGWEAKRRIVLGTYARMEGYRDHYYLRAMRARTLVIRDFEKAFKNVDVLAAPTMPIVAPRLKEIEKMSPTQVYAMDVLTVAPNLAGIPMLSLPCGTSSGLPVGLHLMAPQRSDERLLGIGMRVESVLTS